VIGLRQPVNITKQQVHLALQLSKKKTATSNGARNDCRQA
jgi:hypothetical protein